MQLGVGAEHPIPFSAFRVAVEMNHLAATMDAGIRSAGTVHDHRMVGDPTQRCFNALLYGRRLALALPAIKLRPIVFNPGGQAHGISTIQRRPSSSCARVRLALDPPLTISSSRVRADSGSSMDR